MPYFAGIVQVLKMSLIRKERFFISHRGTFNYSN